MLKISFSAILPRHLLHFGLIGLLCVGCFDLAAQCAVTINEGNETIEACEGDTISISSSIGPSAPDNTCNCSDTEYQWQRDSVSNWVNIQGQTNSTLNATPAGIGLSNGDRIRLLVRCQESNELTSNTIILNITPLPETPDGITAVPTSSINSPICAGISVTLSVNPGSAGETFEWSGGGVDATADFITVNPTSTTTYEVRRRNTCGLSDPASIGVFVAAIPTAVANITSNPVLPCEGAPVTLTASGGTGGIIRWYSGPNGTGNPLASDSTLTIASAMDGAVYSARRGNNCGSSSVLSFTLRTQAPPTAIIKNPPEVICVGQDYTFEAADNNQSGLSYTWNFPGGNPVSGGGLGPIIVKYGNPGPRIVTLRVTDGNCATTVRDTFQVLAAPTLLVNDDAVTNDAQFELPEKIRSNLTLSSNFPDATFTWSFEPAGTGLSNAQRTGSGAAISEQWALASGAQEAELICTVTVTSGACSETYVFSLLIKKLLFVPNVITPNGDGFNDCWHIELLETPIIEASELNIELYTRSGRCVRGCNEAFTVADAMEWCGEGCAAGAYFYRITGPGGFEAKGSLTLVK